MLTQDQIEKLEKLTTHKKYGKLLKSAIPNWKKFKAAKYTFGLEVRNGKFLRHKQMSGCCLMGAALYGKRRKTQGGFLDEIVRQFNLTFKEAMQIECGFDSLQANAKEKSSAFKFAQKVGKIVIDANRSTTNKS